jgi:hypothetical protein
MPKKQKAKRGGSYEDYENPFERKGNGETIAGAPAEFECLTDAVKIEPSDFSKMVSILEGEESNDTRINTLHAMKAPYLFTSAQLIAIVHLTPSVKTRISFIEEIGPRLVDPKAQSSELLDLFRYSEEKRQVEEVLRARAQSVASKQSIFSAGKTGAGGRGGGGGAGRGSRAAAAAAAFSFFVMGAGHGGGRGGRGAGTSTTTATAATAATAADDVIATDRQAGSTLASTSISAPITAFVLDIEREEGVVDEEAVKLRAEANAAIKREEGAEAAAQKAAEVKAAATLAAMKKSGEEETAAQDEAKFTAALEKVVATDKHGTDKCNDGDEDTEAEDFLMAGSQKTGSDHRRESLARVMPKGRVRQMATLFAGKIQEEGASVAGSNNYSRKEASPVEMSPVDCPSSEQSAMRGKSSSLASYGSMEKKSEKDFIAKVVPTPASSGYMTDVGSIANIMSIILTCNMFSFPWSFFKTGICYGALILIASSAVSCTTALSLHRSQQQVFLLTGRVTNYCEIAHYYLGGGWWLSSSIQIATAVSCFGGCIGFYIFIGQILSQLLQISLHVANMILFPPLVLLSLSRSFKDLKIYTVISVFSFILVIVVMYQYAFIVWYSSESERDTHRIHLRRHDSFKQTPDGEIVVEFIGNATFLFAIHYCLLSQAAEELEEKMQLLTADENSSLLQSEVRENAERCRTHVKTSGMQITVSFVLSTCVSILVGVTGHLFAESGIIIRYVTSSCWSS